MSSSTTGRELEPKVDVVFLLLSAPSIRSLSSSLSQTEVTRLALEGVLGSESSSLRLDWFLMVLRVRCKCMMTVMMITKSTIRGESSTGRQAISMGLFVCVLVDSFMWLHYVNASSFCLPVPSWSTKGTWSKILSNQNQIY